MCQGEPEFLGRAVATPTVHLDPGKARPPSLQWFPITKGDRADAGQSYGSRCSCLSDWGLGHAGPAHCALMSHADCR